MFNNGSYINKIMIDSKFRLPSSKSTSNFSIELNESIQLGDNVGCVLSDCVIPHTWFNITDINCKLYLRYIIGGVTTDKILTFPGRNYTIYKFTQVLQDLLNTARASTFTVTSDTSDGSVEIETSVDSLTFKIFSDTEVATRVSGTWTGPFYAVHELNSISANIRNTDLITATYSKTSPYVSGFVDLNPIHAIYITSFKLSTFQNIGPRNTRNVLKKILINSNFGETNTYEWITAEDYTDVSNTNLKILDFTLEDSSGNDIDLNGATVSCSLLFVNIR